LSNLFWWFLSKNNFKLLKFLKKFMLKVATYTFH
jgi:hypothetical protein